MTVPTPLKFLPSFLLVLLFVGLGTCSAANIRTFYSDLGIDSGLQFYTFGGGGGFSINGQANDPTAPEGFNSLSSTITTTGSGFVGVALCYDVTSGGAANPQDLSAYSTSGEARFWIKSSTSNIKVELEYMNGSNVSTKATILSAPIPGWNWNTDHDQWKLYRVSLSGLSGVDFTKIHCPFEITAGTNPNLTSNTTFYADFARWTDTSSIPIFNVTLKNISDNTAVSTITYTTKAGAGWVLADQYIQLDLDPDVSRNPNGWGVQIYTDNKASDAGSFTFTGSTSTDPAGLVDSTDTTKTLKMAWSVKDTTVTVSGFMAPAPVADDPGAGDTNSFQWSFMQDQKTPGFSGNGSAAIATVVDSNGNGNLYGNHFASGPTQFGAAISPHRIYLEANFSNATTPDTYQTNTLRVEYYHD